MRNILIMPLSVLQYRVSAGAYQNKLHDNFRINSTTQIQGINPDRSGIPDEIHHLGSSINRVTNYHEEMSRPSYQSTAPQRGIAAPPLMLWSQARPDGIPLSATTDISTFASERSVGGRKRKTAISVIKEQDGFTENSARELLTRYPFPENGFYSDYNFALEVEQTRMIPRWADQFKKRIRIDGPSEEVLETILLMKPDCPQNKVNFNLGEKIGEGGFGEVFLDADDKKFLIKKYFSDEFTHPTEVATHEAEMFNRYYGEGAAVIFMDEAKNVYVRMYKVPGHTLESLPPNSLPADAVQRFVDMIEKLNKLGIIHNDIHAENILWDERVAVFYPIDINNAREKYFNADPDTKFDMNKKDEYEWYQMLKEIKGKQLP